MKVTQAHQTRLGSPGGTGGKNKLKRTQQRGHWFLLEWVGHEGDIRKNMNKEQGGKRDR